MRAVSKGWTVSTIAIAQSGGPFTVFTGGDLNNDGNYDSNNGSQSDIPNYIAGSGTHLGGFTRTQYKNGIFPAACSGGFNGAANGCPFLDNGKSLVLNPVTQEGNEPINAFNNPGYFDIDLALQKRTELPWFRDQKSSLTLRAEGLNVLNRANLGNVGSGVETAGNNDSGSSQFGRVTSANNPRIIQIGARFQF